MKCAANSNNDKDQHESCNNMEEVLMIWIMDPVHVPAESYELFIESRSMPRFGDLGPDPLMS